jgi:hypothetical protein
VREGEEDCGGGHLEEAGTIAFGQAFRSVQNLGQNGGQRIVLDQMPGDADPFVIAHQMRLGGAVDAQALRLQHGAQIGAGAALAIGARDMEHGRQMVLRIAQRVQQGVDHLQPDRP